MTLSDPSPSCRTTVSLSSGACAFSLVEILVVTSIVGLLLALAAPGFVTLGPNRKMAIHEVAGFLENARARAVAAQAEMMVVFADGNFPGEDGAYRSYTLFTQEDRPAGESGERPLRQLSPWRTLPKGLVLAHSEHFAVEEGMAFRTILDAPARRLFPAPASSGSSEGMVLPYLLFGPDGGVRVPSFSDADALHVGIAEGHYDSGSGRIELTATRPGRGGAGVFANGECLEVGYYTGRSRILTD